MALIQKRIGQLGLAKQTAKGTPAVNPTYAFGLKSGRVVTLEMTQEKDDLTLGSGRIAPHGTRDLVVPGSEATTRVWPKSIPLALYGVLGSISTAGVGPFTHTITPGDDLPYLTMFGRLGGDYTKVEDSKIDELTISWDRAAPLEVAITSKGLKYVDNAGAWTAGTDETRTTYYRPVGGTFKVDAASAVAVVAKIVAGNIRIGNSIQAVPQAASVLPDDVFPGEQDIEVTLTVLVDNLNEWKKAVTGSSGGTQVAGTPAFGSFDVLFTIDANTDLKLAATRVMFVCEFPEADPAGGPVELELVGTVVGPTGGGAAFTATARNDVTTY